MKNNFKNNKLFTIGVEEEYMICSPENFELIDKAEDIMENLDSEFKDRFSYELLLSEIESNTPICDNVDNSINEISKLRINLKQNGEKLGFNVGMSGTHPTANPAKQNFINNESYEWVKNQLKYYASQNITFSTHVHIGLNDPQIALDITNVVRCWIAPLLALSSNSPFFNSFLTGMESSRTFQFGIFPRTNIAHAIKDVDEYESIINNFIDTGAISKPRQIWWKIRPHVEYGTIEFRIFDVQRSLRNTRMIVAICQALVHRIYSDINNNIKFNDYNMEYLNDGLWKSASKGFEAIITNPINEKSISIYDMVNSMLEYVYPSLLYFGTDDVKYDIARILKNGNEAQKQLDIYNSFGMDSLKKYLVDAVEYNLGGEKCQEK